MTTKTKSNLDDVHDALWQRARMAAQAAAAAENAKLGPEGIRGLDCGFAWVVLPGTIAFARWAKKQNIASKGYPVRLHIWYSKLHDIPTQSVSVHEAAARAAMNVLARELGERSISMGSRLD